MVFSGQSETVDLGSIAGQEKKNTSWVVKGDKTGSYEISADFHGTLMPFACDVKARFETTQTINVDTNSGLLITVMPEKAAYLNENYYIQFSIKNTSDKPLYNFRTSLGPYTTESQYTQVMVEDPATGEITPYDLSEKRHYTYADASKCSQTPVLYGNDVIKIDTLMPGDTIYGTYCTVFSAEGDPQKEYYEMVDAMVEVLKGENLGVRIQVAPISSHIYKYILKTVERESMFGDPIDVSTGAYTDSTELLSVTGLNTLSLDLSYNSLMADKKGEAGYGWSHNFESFIKEENGMIFYYTSPYTYAGFISSDAMSGRMYGSIEGDEIVLSDVSDSGKQEFRSISESMDGYVLTRYEDGTYEMKTSGGYFYYYDAEGRLTGMKTDMGQEVTVTITESQKIITEKISGKRLILNYVNGMLTEVADDTGRSAKLSYTDGRLSSITNAAGEEIRHEYDEANRIISSTDNYGTVYVQNTYDEKGRVVSQLNAEGEEITLVYTAKESVAAGTETNTETDAENTEATDTAVNAYEETGDETYTVKATDTDAYSVQESGTGNSGEGGTGNPAVNYEAGMAEAVESAINVYEEAGNETDTEEVTPEEGMKELTRDANGMYIEVRDTRGAVAKAETDAEGRIIRIEEADGGVKTYTYDKDGNLIKSTDPMGETVSYAYDEAGRVTGKTSSDESISLSYDEAGNITKITTGDGETAEYAYDTEGRLIRAENHGAAVSYSYNEEGLVEKSEREGKGSVYYTYEGGSLSSVTDETGNTTYLEYDERGNLIKVTDACGGETCYEYDTLNRKVKTIDAEGGVTSHTYDIYGNILTETDPLGNVTAYAYDISGRLIRKTLPEGEVIGYTYDTEGNLTETIYPDGTKDTYYYDLMGNNIKTVFADGTEETYTYDLLGRVIKTKGTSGIEIEYIYEGSGELSEISAFDGSSIFLTYGNGEITGIKSTGEAKDGTSYESATAYTYDGAGNLTEIKDSLGNVSKAEYNVWGELVKTTDANGNETTYDYDAAGRCIRSVNPEGTEVLYGYDACGRITEIKTEISGEEAAVRYTYDKAGRIKSVTDEEGITESYLYDAEGNITGTADAEGNILITYEYDGDGRVKKEKSADGSTAEYTYNVNGQVEKKTVYGGAGTAFSTEQNAETANVSGEAVSDTNAVTNNVETTSPSSKAYTYEYDAMGRVTKVTDPAEGRSEVTYDSAGNITSLTYPEGGTTTYEYDSAGRLIKEENAIGTAVTYAYDGAGRLSEKTNARGQKTTYTYDTEGRLIKMRDEEGTVSYTYDANGNLLTAEEESGKITRKYDSLNRVTEYTDTRGNTIKYTYDEAGNVTEITYPGGEKVKYTYRKNGDLESVTDADGLKTLYEYDNTGKLIKITSADGSAEERSYDVSGRLIRKTESLYGEIISSYNYTYDEWGNITKIEHEEKGGEKQEYNLGSSSTQTGVSSGQEDNSSETKVTTCEMTYDAANRMITYNGEEVIYDADGNMTYGPVDGEMTELSYDSRNRLVQAGDISYTYDCENIRISKETPYYSEEYVTDTVYTMSRVLIAERTYKTEEGEETQLNTEDERTVQGSTETTRYYYGDGLLYEKGRDGLLVYHYDHLGSTKYLTDKDGNVVYSFTYGTYGELTGEYVSEEYAEKAENNADYEHAVRFMYNGRFGVMTDENGLYYMRARYYNSDIKRFINQDILTGSIGESPSLNRYSYVQGNPVSYLDPFGLSIFDFDLKRAAHAVLDIIGCVPGGIGMGADLLNSLLYLAEGETGEALKSLVFAFVPGGVGALANYGVKAGKLSEKVLTALNYVQASMNTAGTIIGADATGNAIAYMIDKYLVQGAEVTSDTLIECMEIAAGGLQTATSAKGMSDSLPKAEIDKRLKDTFVYIMTDNRGCIDFRNRGATVTLNHQATSGVKLVSTPGKTTTILGRYGSDTGNIIKELDLPKTTDFSENPGGFNLLNTPDDLYTKLGPEGFWNDYNKPFLDAAISRGDEILMSTPINNNTLYTQSGELTGYGREYYYLISKGYEYVDGKMIFKGAN